MPLSYDHFLCIIYDDGDGDDDGVDDVDIDDDDGVDDVDGDDGDDDKA